MLCRGIVRSVPGPLRVGSRAVCCCTVHTALGSTASSAQLQTTVIVATWLMTLPPSDMLSWHSCNSVAVWSYGAVQWCIAIMALINIHIDLLYHCLPIICQGMMPEILITHRADLGLLTLSSTLTQVVCQKKFQVNFGTDFDCFATLIKF